MKAVVFHHYERFKSIFQTFVRENLCWISLFMVCSMPSVFSNVGYVLKYPSPAADIASMVPVCILKSFTESILLAWVCSRLPRIPARSIVIATVFLACCDLAALKEYHFVLSEGLLQAVMATNLQESKEYLYTYREELIQSVLMALTIGWVMFQAVFYGIRRINQDRRILPVVLILGAEAFLYVTLYWGSLPGISIASARCLAILPKSAAELSAYRDLPGRICEDQKELTRIDKEVPHVVFVLGESASRHHMGLYGYDLDTTPYLSAREANGELTVFSDVISPQSVTILSLERLFTFYHNESGADSWYRYGNLFGILRKAGYHTAWLSNQETGGVWGNVGRFYADCCDAQAFVKRRDSLSKKVSAEYDEQLLPLFDSLLQDEKQEPYDFTVIHLMGCHANYASRYPESFAIFQSDEESADTEKKRQARAEYDNAVRYNDYILDQIIRRLEQEDAVLLYISDHGEEVYDVGDYMGHYTNGSFYQLEIPMLIWTSASFRRHHPETCQRIEAAKDRPYMTDDMIHILLDLTGVATDEYDPGRSIIHPDFRADRPRIFNDKVYRRDWAEKKSF